MLISLKLYQKWLLWLHLVNLVWCASDGDGNHFCFGKMYEWVTLFIEYCNVLLILCSVLRNGRTGHT